MTFARLELEEMKQDAAALAAFVNNLSGTVTTRSGRTYPVLAAILGGVADAIGAPPITPPVQALRIAPTGSGNQSGSDWDNAAPIGNINALIQQARAEGKEIWLRADAGPYAASTWYINQGGTASFRVRIRGKDVNGQDMMARIVGTRADPWTAGAASGGNVGHFYLRSGANYLGFQFLRFENCGFGCIRVAGPITNLLVEDCYADNVKAFLLNAVETGVANATINTFTARRCEGHGYSKRMFFLRYNSSNILIEDCTGDAEAQTGDSWSGGVIFDDTAHDFVVRRCSFINNQDIRPSASDYWNADSYANERGNYNGLYEECYAAGNTDRGFDLKGVNLVLLRCIATDSKRNYFLWGQCDVIDCIGTAPYKRGGLGYLCNLGAGPRSRVRVQGGTWSQPNAPTSASVFVTSATGYLAVDQAALNAVSKPTGSPLWLLTDGKTDGIFTTWDHNDTTAPVVTSTLSYTLNENTPAIFTLAANEPCTFRFGGGRDDARFAIDGRSLVMAAQDADDPAQPPNPLQCKIQSVDANANVSAVVTFLITIVNVDDSPIEPPEIYAGAISGAMFVCEKGGMFQDVARTIPAGDGDRVMGMTNLSGDPIHFWQDNPDAAAILRNNGPFWWLETRGVEFYYIGGPGALHYPQLSVCVAATRAAEEGYSDRSEYLYWSGQRSSNPAASVNGVVWMGMQGGQSIFARINPNQGSAGDNTHRALINEPHVVFLRSTDATCRADADPGLLIDFADVPTLTHPVNDTPVMGMRPGVDTSFFRGKIFAFCLTSQGEDDVRRYRIERQLAQYAGLVLTH